MKYQQKNEKNSEKEQIAERIENLFYDIEFLTSEDETVSSLLKELKTLVFNSQEEKK